MKVELKQVSSIKNIAKQVVKSKQNLDNKPISVPEKSLDYLWESLEKQAEHMSAEDYIRARAYLAGLEHLVKF